MGFSECIWGLMGLAIPSESGENAISPARIGYSDEQGLGFDGWERFVTFSKGILAGSMRDDR
jgi:hypothetical protein